VDSEHAIIVDVRSAGRLERTEPVFRRANQPRLELLLRDTIPGAKHGRFHGSRALHPPKILVQIAYSTWNSPFQKFGVRQFSTLVN
jgi:hypothetical protein